MVALPHFFELHPNAPGASHYRALRLQVRARQMELDAAIQSLHHARDRWQRSIEMIANLEGEKYEYHRRNLNESFSKLIEVIDLKIAIIQERIDLVIREIRRLNVSGF